MAIAIRCHDQDPHPHRVGPSPEHPDQWRAAFVPGDEPPVQTHCGQRHWEPFEPYRSCSYCGSIHPEDLLAAIKAGATLGGSDWKYGWPHKFYVEHIPNPYPDLPIVTRHTTAGGVWTCGEPHPAGPFVRAKWYNKHLHDLAGTPLLAELCANLLATTDIQFEINAEGKLRYSAPYAGYQR